MGERKLDDLETIQNNINTVKSRRASLKLAQKKTYQKKKEDGYKAKKFYIKEVDYTPIKSQMNDKNMTVENWMKESRKNNQEWAKLTSKTPGDFVAFYQTLESKIPENKSIEEIINFGCEVSKKAESQSESVEEYLATNERLRAAKPEEKDKLKWLSDLEHLRKTTPRVETLKKASLYSVLGMALPLILAIWLNVFNIHFFQSHKIDAIVRATFLGTLQPSQIHIRKYSEEKIRERR